MPSYCLENPRDWGAWWAAVYGVQCYSLKSSHPFLFPLSPKVCSLHLCLGRRSLNRWTTREVPGALFRRVWKSVLKQQRCVILLALKEEPATSWSAYGKRRPLGAKSHRPTALQGAQLERSMDRGSELVREIPAPVTTCRTLNRESGHIMPGFPAHRHCERMTGCSFQQLSLWWFVPQWLLTNTPWSSLVKTLYPVMMRCQCRFFRCDE